ncbi:MAG: murein transglycosylase A [Chloroflexota bacterium]
MICFCGCAARLLRGPAALPRAIPDDLDAESLRAAIHQSLVYLRKLPPDRVVGAEPREFTAQEVADSLLAFEDLLQYWRCPARFAREVAVRFDFVPSSVDAELAQVLFTGYYQPVLNGSLTRTERFRYPIYGKPADLITAEQVTLGPKPMVEKVVGRAEGEQFIPYYSRREIDEEGALQGRGLEIAWVDDPVELFFLHIQGSGLIRLPDGELLSVGYAGQNGRSYRSIGRLLIDDGAIPREEMSMQRLRRYLDDNPQKRSEVFNYNESYVFFRLVQNGPLGSLEVPVTPGRSIATDARLFPKGGLVWIQTEIPRIDNTGQFAGWRPITRFALNQDTGGAIRGLQRADIYFGSGEEGAGLAGYMNRPGKMFFLTLKSKPPPADNGLMESCAEPVSKGPIGTIGR